MNSLIIQLFIILFLMIYIYINYNNPYLFFGEYVNETDGIDCNNNNDCYGECIKDDTLDDIGKCSNETKKNLWKNIISIIIYLIFIFIYVINLINNNYIPLVFVLLICTFIILYSLRINIEKSPIEQSLNILIKDSNIEENIIETTEKMDLFNNKQFNKTTLIFIFYFIFILIMYFTKWKSNCNYNSLLCNNNILFIFTYFAFSVYILLDSFKITNIGLFNTNLGKNLFEHSNSKDVLFGSNWILNSIIYCIYFLYILLVVQGFNNTLSGENNTDLNIFIISTIFIIMVNFYQNYVSKKLKDSCDCNELQIYNSSNDINMIQYNNIILIVSMLLVVFFNKIYNLNNIKLV